MPRYVAVNIDTWPALNSSGGARDVDCQTALEHSAGSFNTGLLLTIEVSHHHDLYTLHWCAVIDTQLAHLESDVLALAVTVQPEHQPLSLTRLLLQVQFQVCLILHELNHGFIFRNCS